MRFKGWSIRLLAAFLIVAAPAGSIWAAVSERAAKVLVEKSKRSLSLIKDGQVFKTYRVSLGREPVGAKTEQGDGKTPEGNYVIDARNPHSQFHRSLRVSYPNATDRKQAKARGVSPGGQIMIHGLPNGLSDFGKTHLLVDWTGGCVAVTDSEIEEIWEAVKNGTKVQILP